MRLGQKICIVCFTNHYLRVVDFVAVDVAKVSSLVLLFCINLKMRSKSAIYPVSFFVEIAYLSLIAFWCNCEEYHANNKRNPQAQECFRQERSSQAE